MKIALLGYGKMGKAIEKIAIERGHQIVLKTNSSTLFSPDDLYETDVAIEFSTPKNAVYNIMTCFEANTPVVVGTTGWYKDFKMISERCINEERTLLHATNFSVGVNLFFEINKRLAELMNPYSQYSASIEEIHHTEKLDAPSGTAITLAEDTVSNLDLIKGWKNNTTIKDNEVLITSKRLPNVPGTHTVKYESKIDTIEITHTAKSREGFALGAVLAAEFTLKRKGLLTMKDVLFCFE